MVGWLIQYQEIDALAIFSGSIHPGLHQPGQIKSAFLAAGQIFHLFKNTFTGKKISGQFFTCLALPDNQSIPKGLQYGHILPGETHLLRQIADSGAGAHTDAPCVCRELSQYHTEQRCLSAPVSSKQSHMFLIIHLQIEIGKKLFITKAFCNAFQQQNILSGTLTLLKSYPHSRALVFRTLHFFHPVQPLLHGGRPLIHTLIISLRRPGTHILDCLFHSLNFLLLFLVSIQLPLPAPFLFLQVIRIIPQIFHGRPVLYLQDSGSRGIQKIPVVGNHKHSPFIVLQIFLQPLQHGHIQMVRRFIKHQDIRILQKDLCQAGQRLFTSAERPELRLQKFAGQLKPRTDTRKTLLHFISAACLIPFLQKSIFFQKNINILFAPGTCSILQRSFQRLHLLLQHY